MSSITNLRDLKSIFIPDRTQSDIVVFCHQINQADMCFIVSLFLLVLEMLVRK